MTDQPDWSKLPWQPQQFFGLADHYDRKDLKRAYTRLIKIFKPETAPEQFQKIREAYEQLEQQLKRQQPDADSQFFHYPVDIPFDALTELDPSNFTLHELPEQPAGGPTASGSESEAIRQILEKSTPVELFQQLVNHPQKTPDDYIKLIFLCETVEHPAQRSFLEWLCEGLKSYPDDPSLHRLAFHYCRDLPESVDLEETLLKLCSVLSMQRMLYITEPLWGRLLLQDYSRFRENWDQHINPVRELHAAYIVPFLTDRLIALTWLADEAWLQDQLAFINTHFNLIQNYQEYQLELHDILSKFLKFHQHLAENKPQEIQPFLHWYEELKQFCLANTPAERERFAEYQRSLANRYEIWSADFQLNNSHRYQVLMARVWEWLSHHANLDSNYWQKRPNNYQATRCVREWIVKLKPPYLVYLIRAGLSPLTFFVFCICLMPVGQMLARLTMSLLGFSIASHETTDAVILTLIASTAISLFCTWKIDSWFNAWLRCIYYLKYLRPKAAEFFSQTGVTYLQYVSALEEWLIAENGQLYGYHLIYGKQIKSDAALIIYRCALNFLICRPVTTDEQQAASSNQ